MKELAKMSRFGMAFLLLGLLGIVSSCEQKNLPPEDIRRDATVIAVQKVMPSVVNVVAATRVQHDVVEDQIRKLYGLPGLPAEERADSFGSGVIIDVDGYVLTSLHVVLVPGRSRVAVKLSDGREFDCDPLIVNIPNSDVALLKIHAPPGEKFQPIVFAKDDDLLLGETVIAIGNPLNLSGSVTKGILSSRSRRLPTLDGPLNYRDWLQTDAAINEGNSGGPLVNLRGEMIGLNEAVVTNQQSIGFAIPVRQVQVAISQFFTPEVMNHILFGGQLRAGNGPLHFWSVQPDEPAYQAGIRVGDQVVAVNGRPVENPIQFHRELCGWVTNKNLEAKLVVRRNGENYNATVHLVSFDDLLLSKLGITVRDTERGLRIETVEPDSPAAVAQLQTGFYLAGIDRQPTPYAMYAARMMSPKKKGDPAALMVVLPQSNGLPSPFNQTVQVMAR